HRGAPIVGLIDMPILGERWLGVLGRGTTLNGAPSRTRAAVALAEARMGTTSPDIFAAPEDRAVFARLRAAVADCNYGGDCYNYAVLASGCLDLVMETTLKPWDFAALAPVVIAAGGAMTDWSGRPLTLESAGDVLASSDPSLHRAALTAISGG
ncbi:MAG: inositol monophosphatase family protein, partial [Alphaproteobacteria bacterium]